MPSLILSWQSLSGQQTVSVQAEASYVTDKHQTKNDDYVLFCAMLLQEQLQSRSNACTVAILTGANL